MASGLEGPIPGTAGSPAADTAETAGMGSSLPLSNQAEQAPSPSSGAAGGSCCPRTPHVAADAEGARSESLHAAAATEASRSESPHAAADAETSRKKTPGELEALESFRQDARKAQLLFVVEQYIGKPLSLKEVRSIYYLSEVLHFSDEMIDYLLQYCIDRGKRDFRYIRKVAENWAESGITTPSQAESAAGAGDAAESRGAAASDSGPEGRGGTFARRTAASLQNTQKKSRGASRSRTSNSFNQFEQNRYDFDALEAELLQDS